MELLQLFGEMFHPYINRIVEQSFGIVGFVYDNFAVNVVEAVSGILVTPNYYGVAELANCFAGVVGAGAGDDADVSGGVDVTYNLTSKLVEPVRVELTS